MIIEMNAESVRKERTKGKPIFYGDATQETVLHYAGVTDARVVVVAISDAAATRRITETVRRLNSKVQLIARTRFVQEVKPLHELGADEVVPEEFETSDRDLHAGPAKIPDAQGRDREARLRGSIGRVSDVSFPFQGFPLLFGSELPPSGCGDQHPAGV